MAAAGSVDQSATLFTPRLELWALTLPTVTALLESRPRGEIEALVGAEMPWTWPSRALVDQVFQTSLDAIRADPVTRLWGDRLMVTREGGPKVIGSVIFHGRPGDDGVCEVAFGVEDSSQGRGYATEALSACITWALAQPECRIVRAQTAVWHKASNRLLAKVGLSPVGDSREGGAEMRTYEIARS